MQTITSSPWGTPDSAQNIGGGILRIDTPSHGGYFVPEPFNSIIPNAWKTASFNGQASAGWYEEDCDWCMVALAFPTTFPPHAADARRMFDQVIQPKIDGRIRSARHET
jgi:hypothetical protein